MYLLFLWRGTVRNDFEAAISITRAIIRGGPWNRDFFGPWNGKEPASPIWAQKIT